MYLQRTSVGLSKLFVTNKQTSLIILRIRIVTNSVLFLEVTGGTIRFTESNRRTRRKRTLPFRNIIFIVIVIVIVIITIFIVIVII